MYLRSYLPPENQLVLQHNQPDVISLAFLEILKAMPSTAPFSVQVFISIWNSERPGLTIGPNEDILSLSDFILSHLPLPDQANGTPVLTELLASVNCPDCGHQAQNITDWVGKSFMRIPYINNIVQSNQPVPVGELLNEILSTPIPTVCNSCRSHNAIGTHQVKKGLFTVLNVNRTGHAGNMGVCLTKLSTVRTQTVAEQYLGELLSCISHTGNPMAGHYFSYNVVNGQWFVNSDAHPIQQVAFHPFNSSNIDEKVTFLVYKN